MIWQSTTLMTVIDVLIIGVTVAAVLQLWKARTALASAGALRSAMVLIAGLSVTALVYFVDLYTMHVLPRITSPMQAMATMESLHLNWHWIASLAAVTGVCIGFVGIVRSGVELSGELRKTAAQRESVEATLATVEDRFRMSLKAAEMGTWAFDPRDDSVQWSDRVAEVFGLRPEVAPRSYRAYQALIHPDDRERVATAVQGALASGGAYDVEHRVVTPEGETRWVAARGWVYLGESGEAELMTGVAWDVTEARRASAARAEAERTQEELQRRLDRQQRLESLGTLSGGIAHDFNNLLTPILGHVEMLREDTADPDQQERLEQVRIAAERARGLIRQILAFGGRVQPAGGAVDAAEAVTEALDLVRATLPSTIEIRTAVEPSGSVGADSTQLTQVLVNLCTNAAHAMPEGGTLTVGVSRIHIDEQSVASYPDLDVGAYVKVSVSDTGTGMRSDVAERAFEPFFTTKDVGEGSGLGLSQVLGIVSTYEGSVMLYSELDKGTTIHVFFPSVEDDEAEPAVEASSDARTCRVLLVDDEPAVSKLMARMLESLGYAVTVEHSALTALERFERDPAAFDLLITDQTMPGMTGTALVERARTAAPQLPSILMSGFTDPEHARESDVVFLMKPFTKLQLGQALSAALEPGT